MWDFFCAILQELWLWNDTIHINGIEKINKHTSVHWNLYDLNHFVSPRPILTGTIRILSPYSITLSTCNAIVVHCCNFWKYHNQVLLCICCSALLCVTDGEVDWTFLLGVYVFRHDELVKGHSMLKHNRHILLSIHSICICVHLYSRY